MMQYLCNKNGLTKFYPTDPAARATIDSAMFYLIGTLYPLIAKATYGALGFRITRARSVSDASDEAKAVAKKQYRLMPSRSRSTVQPVLPRRQALHRRRLPLDCRHPVWPRRSSSCG